ncbi:hypothetical protein BpHYR1_028550 [Brachionus plicatilis]|uniref:Uncharacterized protein n=1 Tax=Brachionus plicatilis TaxID=10195 RepID=A0A3M7Q614_BRAPC|nr:hypothetical protein BpHYR1_028550 [Brachionus plicatilis]
MNPKIQKKTKKTVSRI